MSETRIIEVDRCGYCPYREDNDDVADGTGDYCIKRSLFFDYRAYMKKGEFPKRCPLKEKK